MRWPTAGRCLPAPRPCHLDGTPTPHPERAPAAAQAPTSPATRHGTLRRTKKLCSNPSSCEVAHPLPPASFLFPLVQPLLPPGPSTPSMCPGPGERPRGKEGGTVKVGHPPPPQSPSRSGLATSLVPTLWPEPLPGPGATTEKDVERSHSVGRQPEQQGSPLGPACWTGPTTLTQLCGTIRKKQKQ